MLETEGYPFDLETNLPTEKGELIKEHVSQYKKDLQEIVEDVYFRPGQSADGVHKGISYHETSPERTGKQQKVSIIQFLFPDGFSFEMVCKFDDFDMFRKQNENEVLQRRLPKIFLERESVIGIEKLNGLQMDKYREYLNESSHLKQLIDESFEIFDDVSRNNFFLNDVDFVDGHNILFDTDTQRFRVFDVHSFLESNEPYAKKLLDFLNQEAVRIRQRSDNEAEMRKRVKFCIGFIQKLLEKYPNQNFSYQGTIERNLIPGTEEYQQALEKIKSQRPGRSVGTPQIKTNDTGKIGLRRDIQEICLKGDEEAFIQALSHTATPMSEFIL